MNPRVLHIVYNLIRGGTEGQCARVALGFRKRGADHRMAVFEKRGYFLPKVEQSCGRVWELNIRHVRSPKTWIEVRRLAVWLRREHIELVHAWDADSAMFGSLACLWARVPFITSRRDMGEIYPAWKLRWMTWADRRARAVVVNARAIESVLLQAGYSPKRVRYIPNLMDISEFDRLAGLPFSQASRLPPGRWLVMAARLDPEKDAPTLIEAFAKVAGSFPDLTLVLAGDGPDRTRCESRIHELDLTRRVVMLGEVDDVPALLARSTIGALVPSRNEGQSNAILEYFAAGLPVVATDCGGNRELVEGHGAGWLVPPASPNELAEAIRDLLRHPDRARRMGQAGRKAVEKTHALETVLDQFDALYKTCVQSTE